MLLQGPNPIACLPGPSCRCRAQELPAGADQDGRSVPPTDAEAHAFLRCYLRLLRELFGQLIINPLVLPLGALEAPGGAVAGAGNGACLPSRRLAVPAVVRPICCRAAQSMHANCSPVPLCLAPCPPACPCAEGSELAVLMQRTRDLCKRFVVVQQPLAWQEAVLAAKALVRAGMPCTGYESQALREARRQLDAEAKAATAVLRKRRRTSGGEGAGEGGAGSVYTASVDRWGQPQVQVSEGEWPACPLACLPAVGGPGEWVGAPHRLLYPPSSAATPPACSVCLQRATASGWLGRHLTASWRL